MEDGFVEFCEALHFGGGGDGAAAFIHFVAQFGFQETDCGCGIFHGDDGEGNFGEEGEEGFFDAVFVATELPDFLCPVDWVDAVDGGFCEGGEVVGMVGDACITEDVEECFVFRFGEVNVEVFSHGFSSFFDFVEVTGQWSLSVFF